MRLPCTLALATLTAAAPLTAAAQGAFAPRVDSIFAPYARPGSPGCAVGVFRSGQIAYSRGYGMANIELGVPITPEHVFYVGSVSKQFTAMSVALLAKDGRLSLDDDVHKFIPELPDFGQRITIRNLVHHTSGLREKWDLFLMAGMRDGDVVTQADVIDLVRRQKALNFAPGEEWLYNNTAYDLLSTIVQRASGKPHREFAQERIFGPLGMASTRYIDDRTLVVPGRANAYAPRPGGSFVTANVSYVETTGSGGVHSTIGDLLRWDESFYTGALGGPALTTLVQTPGTLNSGDKLTYAFGLTIDQYGGRRRVQHGGALGGYRAMLMRFPDDHFSVALLCNIASANTNALAELVTDVYFPRPASTAAATHAAVAMSLGDAELQRYAGLYLNLRTEAMLRVLVRDGALAVEGIAAPLRYDGSRLFRVDAQQMVLDFEVPQAGRAQRVRVTRPSSREARYDRVSDLAPNGPLLGDYAGIYRSDELNITWRIALRDEKVTIFGDRWADGIALTPVFADAFTAGGRGWLVRFGRDGGSVVDNLTVTTGRSRRVAFAKERER